VTTVKRVCGLEESHFCAPCRVSQGYQQFVREKQYELAVAQWLTEEGLHFSYSNRKLPCARTTRFPDFLFVAEEHCVLLEVDEHEHRANAAQCEVARLSELQDALKTTGLHVIRYNPHSHALQDARNAVVEAVKTALAHNFTTSNDTACVVEYLGYSERRLLTLQEAECYLQTGIFAADGEVM
jgi:very-short-patch-repair endonuclease